MVESTADHENRTRKARVIHTMTSLAARWSSKKSRTTPGPFSGPPSLFQAASPLPGVVPSGFVPKSIAQDEAFGEPWAGGGSFVTSFDSDALAFPGFPYLAALAQRAEYRNVTETTAKEATREGFTVVATGSDNTGQRQQRIERVTALLRQHRIPDKLRELATLDGFFGRAHLYVEMANAADDKEKAAPLFMSPAKIAKGSIQSFRVVDPSWVYPAAYDSVDPLSPDFYSPSSWFVSGRQVHSTRLLTFLSRPVPALLRPAYAFSGVSLSQLVRPYVDNWLRTRTSVADLIESFSIVALATNMSTVLQGDAADDLEARVNMFNAGRHNRGLFVLDKETEALSNIAVPLSGLDHLQAQALEHIALPSHLPLSVLLGSTPSGLNATSEGELLVFYSWIKTFQEALFGSPLRYIVALLHMSEFGFVDPDLDIEFRPLQQPKPADRAATRAADAQADAAYIDAGVVTPQEVRDRLTADPGSGFSSLSKEIEPADMLGMSEPANPFEE